MEDKTSVIPRSTNAIDSNVDSSQQRDTLRHDGGHIYDTTSLEVRDIDIDSRS